jgi:hypothetical protein
MVIGHWLLPAVPSHFSPARRSCVFLTSATLSEVEGFGGPVRRAVWRTCPPRCLADLSAALFGGPVRRFLAEWRASAVFWRNLLAGSMDCKISN